MCLAIMAARRMQADLHHPEYHRCTSHWHPNTVPMLQPVKTAGHSCANPAASYQAAQLDADPSPQRPTQDTVPPASCAAPAPSGAAPPSHAPQCPPWSKGHASGYHTCPQSQTPAVWSDAAWSPVAACESAPPPCSARCRGTQRGEALLACRCRVKLPAGSARGMRPC